MSATPYDALIIGSGQAGNPLAYALAEAGRRVALIESAHLGGSCVNYGCAPTKMLLASAQRAHLVRTAGELGINASAPTVDFAAVVARKDRLTQNSRDGIEHSLTTEHPNIRLVRGRARFTAPNTLHVDLNEQGGQEQLTAPLIFINTGTHAAVPLIPGLELAGYLTNDTLLLGLTELPEHLLILGGSYIGVEFGQMFRRLGARVTIIETSATLMDREDPDVSRPLQELLAAEGIELVLEAEVRHVSRNAEGVLTLTADTPGGERRLRGSHLLVATGRVPNTLDMGLELAGIPTDEDGYIVVDNDLRTPAKGVYALGDVKGGPQFTHIAYDDYRIVRDQLLHGRARDYHDRPVPYVVFTEPQLGRIGLSKTQAREQKVPFRVSRLPAGSIGRAVETGQTAGFVEVLVGDDDRLLGAAVLCEQGGEIMTMFQLAMAGGLRYQQLENLVIAHPTWAEVLNNAFQRLKRG
ncbi:mercuric reductase [Hymenobacter actinosclerus]|uniref:Pyruvate/2-oxoglutarate dehydrogenase complex, dihydrolipoamide dehydrogenase (E3) component n=1 Tax=Hymenobacter actinosclerus TaxID=82805 RepID=A0A1I0A6N7_9BACT|nr:mercuric reductase [Hymenobacter actinosclerus]SES89346.1 Pyruvate/2-oxoglutarate dehydrogenase complex, dihydrolipoamide dehydrogenase (E3) component [Hymenobacter actinosclerus]